MTSLFSSNHQSSSSISEGSSAPPSPASSVHCARSTASLSVSNAASPGVSSAHNVPQFGTWIPNRVFVGGISNTTTETDLQERFDSYGTIKDIKIIRDRSGMCKGYGFITFESDEAAKRAQNEREIIVLKERRLNIAPAVIKQSFNRPYDLAQPGPLVYHHNGTSYAFDNGMAFFTPGPAQSPFSAREAPVFSSPFGPTQGSATGHTFSPLMYPYTPQPLAYVPTGQQFSYQPIPFDPYFKASAPAASQYLYGPPSGLNGTLNGPSPNSTSAYGQPPVPPGLAGPGSGHSGPPLPPTAQYFHPAADVFYNGGAPHGQQALYQIDGSHDEYDTRERDNATPVVSLLKLQERGIEEMEITRTPKKPSLGGSVQQYRSIYPSVQLHNQRPPRVRRLLNSAQAGGPPPGGRSGRGNNHRPYGSMPGPQGGHGGPGRPHVPRRVINLTRNGPRNPPGATNSRPAAPSPVSPAVSPAVATASPSPTATPPPSEKAVLVDELGHHLPLSPPETPAPVAVQTPSAKASGVEDGDLCQGMQALAM